MNEEIVALRDNVHHLNVELSLCQVKNPPASLNEVGFRIYVNNLKMIKSTLEYFYELTFRSIFKVVIYEVSLLKIVLKNFN